MNTANTEKLVENFFRHESANLIALLTRTFGFSLVDVVEDMVQEAMMEALRSWRIQGVPQNPVGWLHRVARNRIVDTLRRDRSVDAELDQVVSSESPVLVSFTPEAFQDSLLRLIFVCCHSSLDRKSQLALTLKMLCGLGDHEIAHGLLSSPAAIKKRVTRAKRHLQLNQVAMELPAGDELHQRLEVVHEVLYLMFNEGYSASTGSISIRLDLCEEAARLCHLLCESELGQPSTHGLLALMLFHAARFQSRQDQDGSPILLREQDRSLWDQSMIRVADYWLHKSGTGTAVSRYHLEAVISRIHCFAKTYEETDWDKIVAVYEILQLRFPSPMHVLNRAIALGQTGNLQQAIAELEALKRDDAMSKYAPLWCSLAELLEESGQADQAIECWERALQLTESERNREFVRAKLRAHRETR